MKKILFTLMACVLCLGLIGGAFAYFSDTAASNANTFYAGDVDITLSGSLADGVTLDDMAPGDTVTGTLYVTNTGSLPIWFSGYLANDWAQSIGGFIDKFTVKVTTIPGDFYNFNPSQVIYNGPLTGLAGKENGLITANGVYTALPGGGQWAGYTFAFTLDGPSTGSEFELAWLQGKLTVDAVQSNNISWANAYAFLKNGTAIP